MLLCYKLELHQAFTVTTFSLVNSCHQLKEEKKLYLVNNTPARSSHGYSFSTGMYGFVAQHKTSCYIYVNGAES